MREVYIIEAARTPIGRRGGELSSLHPADLLGAVQEAVLTRSGVDPKQVGQIIGVTKERVRQIQNKALEKIRLAVEENAKREEGQPEAEGETGVTDN